MLKVIISSFGKALRLFFSSKAKSKQNITLVENNEVISSDAEVA